MVSELLNMLDIPAAVPMYNAGDDVQAKLRLYESLSEVVRIQLRYDSTRFRIISYLYGLEHANNQIPEIIWPFVDAADITAPEPYYLDAVPDAEGRCMWCGLHLSRQVSRYYHFVLKLMLEQDTYERTPTPMFPEV
jgi:hypothetical protein